MKKTILIILLGFGFVSADIKKEFFANGALKYISISQTHISSARSVKTYYANGGLKKEFSQDKDSNCYLKIYQMNGNLKKEHSFNSAKDCNLLP